MKGTLAMTLTLVRDWARRGVRPGRDVVLAFLADEEATGEYGARYAVRHHRELFDGCTEAISESGGYSVEAPERADLPDRGGRARHRLDATHRDRRRGSRLPPAGGQRGGRALPRHVPDRLPPLAGAADARGGDS